MANRWMAKDSTALGRYNAKAYKRKAGRAARDDARKDRTPHDPNDREQMSERDRRYAIDRDWRERDSPQARAKARTKSRGKSRR